MITIETVSERYQQAWLQLYQEAFPAYERFDWTKLDQLAKENIIQLRALVDRQTDHLVGLAVLVEFANGGAYLLYFAIVKAGRGQGLGGQAITSLKKQYPAGIILECEKRDARAENANQRERRYAFYLAHGFEDTGYLAHNQDADFHLLRSAKQVMIADYVWATEQIQLPTQIKSSLN